MDSTLISKELYLDKSCYLEVIWNRQTSLKGREDKNYNDNCTFQKQTCRVKLYLDESQLCWWEEIRLD